MSKLPPHPLTTTNEPAAAEPPGQRLISTQADLSGRGAAKKPSAPPPHWRTALKRKTAHWSRWLHIYLSTISFAILFFFAVTGLTLNHTEWFSEKQATTQHKGKVELNWVKTSETDPNAVAKLEVVEFLRKAHSIKGALGDFRVDESQCSVSFKGPGYAADTFINRETGEYELTETRMGFVAVINDLHKGRDSGKGWSLIIDISAVLMTLVSVTGMVLLYFAKSRRLMGFVTAGVGAVLCYLIYVVWVP